MKSLRAELQDVSVDGAGLISAPWKGKNQCPGIDVELSESGRYEQSRFFTIDEGRCLRAHVPMVDEAGMAFRLFSVSTC